MSFWSRCLKVLTRSTETILLHGEPYLKRHTLLDLPFLRIHVHKIMQSDSERELHDHPWNFWSLILKGWYQEHLTHGRSLFRGPGSLRYVSAPTLHRLELVGGEPVWTLVICGRKRRKWGFQTSEGWVYWKDFERLGELHVGD
jgi:hypothetical protein